MYLLESLFENSAFTNCETHFYFILKVESETSKQLVLIKNYYKLIWRKMTELYSIEDRYKVFIQ